MSNNGHNAATEFMLAEYRDLYENVMHIENKLFNHLTFYTTLFVGLVTTSVAILQLLGGSDGAVSAPIMIGVAFLLFFAISRYELRMTMELRIRKIKFIEGITQIREYFVAKNPGIAGSTMLPVGLHKAPPYLRVRSKDWYQILYMCFMNGTVALIVYGCIFVPVIGWLIRPLHGLAWWMIAAALVSGCVSVGLILFIWIFWWFSYQSVADFCASYDVERERRMGRETEYDLLERRLPRSRLHWSFGDWIVWFDMKRGSRREE